MVAVRRLNAVFSSLEAENDGEGLGLEIYAMRLSLYSLLVYLGVQ
jgi:hypothetical protein